MSPLWSGMQLKTTKITKKPSPTNQTSTVGFAQSPGIQSGGRDRRKFPKNCAIEGISLPISWQKDMEAGMTVEAAVILPLFLFFLINLSCAIELIRLHGNLQLALWDTCSRLAIYGYALDDNDAASLFSVFYIRDQLVKYVGEDYLDNAPLEKGDQSLTFWESDIFSSQDEMDVIVTYQVSPWSSMAGFLSFRMANRYYTHIWTGYGIPDDPEESLRAVDVVYMTENGSVYHEDRGCTHLQLSVHQVSRAEALSGKNQWGERYSPCEKCDPEATDQTLYITDEGNRYHANRDCSGLKRTVFSVPRSRVEGYRACSRCG